MKITFDPTKHAITLTDRGFAFEDAAKVFAGQNFDLVDDRRDYSELRVGTVGFSRRPDGHVVWTPRGATRHVFSMRKCNAREQKRYKKQFE